MTCDEFPGLQVILRAREAEMQFLRQEAQSLKEELKIARMVVLLEMYRNNRSGSLSQELYKKTQQLLVAEMSG